MCTRHPIVNNALEHLKLRSSKCGIGVHGKVYDVSSFSRVHPGGSMIFELCLGHDASALYESVHVNIEGANATLASLPILGSYDVDVNIAFDYQHYNALRRAVFDLFPTRKSRSLSIATQKTMCIFMALTLMFHTKLLLVTFGTIRWGVCVMTCSVLNAICGSYGHSSIHRFHWTSILLDWNGLSCYEWIFEHVISHHPHVNTPQDHDAISLEPFLRWIPSRKKAWLGEGQTSIAMYFISLISELAVSIQGLFVHRCRWEPLMKSQFPLWIRLAPFVFLIRVASHIAIAIWNDDAKHQCITFLSTFLISGFYFSTLAHMNHTNTCVHKDFLRHQLANTDDLSIRGPVALFLDRQIVHHLFPSVDHGQWTRKTQTIILQKAKEFT